MIVISNSLVLAPIDTPYAGTPWIGYDNKVTSTNVSTTTAAAGQPASNLADPATHTLWVGTTTGADEFIRVSSLPATAVDYLAVARHDFGSSQAALTAQGSTNNGSTWTDLAGPQIAPDNSPILFRWTPAIYTDVRLKIASGGLAVPVAAVMYVGKLLVMERGIDVKNDHVPMKFGRKTNIVSGMSEQGNFLGRVVVGSYRESKAEFAHITPTFYRASIDPFLVASKLIPFFWVWNPSEYPGECAYAWMVNEPQPATSPITRRVALEFEMRGVQ